MEEDDIAFLFFNKSPETKPITSPGYLIDFWIVPGSKDGGPRSSARRCQLFDGDGEEQIYSSGPGEQENHPPGAQVITPFTKSLHVLLWPRARVCLPV